MVKLDEYWLAILEIGQENLLKNYWDSLPERYRQNATCYTDFWQAYKQVIPESQHRPVGKESGEKNHIEHPNNTFRKRLSRLVRRTLSFSKSLFNLRSAV
ncbi:MAG: hypothetical protein GC158_08825 [Cyanobacteria bacterium RI_101]|nr:hypothetical protein [Cyanobacteria bacterium RI_101]